MILRDSKIDFSIGLNYWICPKPNIFILLYFKYHFQIRYRGFHRKAHLLEASVIPLCFYVPLLKGDYGTRPVVEVIPHLLYVITTVL